MTEVRLFGGPGHGTVVDELAADQPVPQEWVFTHWLHGEGFVAWAYIRWVPTSQGILFRFSGIRVPIDPRVDLIP